MASSKQLNLQLKPLMDIFGMKEVVRQLCEENDMDDEEWVRTFLASMTPKRRRALKNRLQEQSKDD